MTVRSCGTIRAVVVASSRPTAKALSFSADSGAVSYFTSRSYEAGANVSLSLAVPMATSPTISHPPTGSTVGEPQLGNVLLDCEQLSGGDLCWNTGCRLSCLTMLTLLCSVLFEQCSELYLVEEEMYKQATTPRSSERMETKGNLESKMSESKCGL